MIRFFKIDFVKPTFKKYDLTKLGHLDPKIFVVQAFKCPQGKFLAIELTGALDAETDAQFLRKIESFGTLPEVVDAAVVDNLQHELHHSVTTPDPAYKYRLYFDRPTYVR